MRRQNTLDAHLPWRHPPGMGFRHRKMPRARMASLAARISRMVHTSGRIAPSSNLFPFFFFLLFFSFPFFGLVVRRSRRRDSAEGVDHLEILAASEGHPRTGHLSVRKPICPGDGRQADGSSVFCDASGNMALARAMISWFWPKRAVYLRTVFLMHHVLSKAVRTVALFR